MFGDAAYNFWLGDTTGMIVVIPAAVAIGALIYSTNRLRLYAKDRLIIFVVVMFTIVSAFISARKPYDHHLFYLLFPPLIWMSIKFGFMGSALSLLLAQLSVVAAVGYFRVSDDQFGVFQILMFILSATGLLLGVVITERGRAEGLLRDQRAELARVGEQAAAGAIASTIAHEISQPLSAMAVYVHSACLILDREDSAETVAEARAALAEAEAQAKRTRTILERIRDFVAGGSLRLEKLNIAELIEKISRLNAAEAKERGVAVEVEIDAAMAAVRADRVAIEQALNNLIKNAVDSAAARGDALGRVVIRLARRRHFVVVEVDDNGAGVAPEVAEKLFEPFETTKAQGMGLGLPLALQVARRHSGQLLWRPLAPQGAQFTIELPVDGPGSHVN